MFKVRRNMVITHYMTHLHIQKHISTIVAIKYLHVTIFSHLCTVCHKIKSLNLPLIFDIAQYSRGLIYQPCVHFVLNFGVGGDSRICSHHNLLECIKRSYATYPQFFKWINQSILYTPLPGKRPPFTFMVT